MAAAAGDGGGGGGGSGDGDMSGKLLKVKDVVWDRGRSDMPVIIGQGTSGTVYAGRLRGQPVAIKAEVLKAGEEEAWLKAVRLHLGATSPHIVAVHGIIVDREGDPVTHYIVMERLAGTMTARLLTSGGAHHDAVMALRLKLLADVAGGLAYLHSSSVIHADVKPDNVLLSASMPPVAKLADFGSSVLRHAGSKPRDTLMGPRGTLVYMDPVLLDDSGSITAASDVYSFGIMAWQVLSGCVPYEADMIATLPTATGPQMVEALRWHVLDGGRPPVAALVERGVPPTVVTLVQSCWTPVQASRPAMAEVHRVRGAAAMAAGAGATAVGGSGGGGGQGPAPAPAAPPVSPAALHATPAPAPAAPVVSAPLAYEWGDKVVLHGHTGGVVSLALLSDGRLASGDYSGEVLLWDSAHGDEPTTLMEGRGGEVAALAALPDDCLAAGIFVNDGEGGLIEVWDTGVVPPSRRAAIDCGSGVYALAVLHDGGPAAGCKDGGVRLVEVDAGAVAMTLKGHTGTVAALTVLPDGTLASGSRDSMVRLWDVGAGKCVVKLAGHTAPIYALAVLADGRLASGSNDYSVRLWDVRTRACVDVLGGLTDRVCALAALPDGRLVSGSTDETIRVWDTRPTAAAGGAGAGAARATPVVLSGHTWSVLALQLVPGGRLASGSADGTVRLWRLPPPS